MTSSSAYRNWLRCAPQKATSGALRDTQIRLGVTADSLDDDGNGVSVRFSDGTTGRFDLVVGADGYLSRTRRQVFPQSPAPEFIGQSVWRYNFPKPPEVTCLRAFEGPIGYGLVPLSDSLMYMFITTPEPGNPRYDPSQLAMSMRSKLKVVPPEIAERWLDHLLRAKWDGLVSAPLAAVQLSRVTSDPTRPTRCAITSSAILPASRPTRVGSSVAVP